MFPIAILDGGLATRLYPFTRKHPKAMIKVRGEPFIDHQLKLLKVKGLTNVVLCVGFLGEEIQNHVGGGSKFGLSVRYSYDGKKLLGTGGALRKAFNLLEDNFWVMYGDSYLDTDFSAIYDYFMRFGQEKLGLLTVFKNDQRWDRSNIEFRQDRIIRYDKKNSLPQMQYIDYGLSILKKEALVKIKAGEVFDLADIYTELVAAGKVLGYEVKERFYEIGSRSGLKETAAYLEKSRRGENGN